MVNIISVVHLSPIGVFHFGNFQDFWNNCYSRANPVNRARLDRLIQLMSIGEQLIHEKYFIPLNDVKHIGFVFISSTEAMRRMEYAEDRELLTNPNNKVVLQIRETPSRTQTVATVYTNDLDYHIITSASDMSLTNIRRIVLSGPSELERQS